MRRGCAEASTVAAPRQGGTVSGTRFFPLRVVGCLALVPAASANARGWPLSQLGVR